MPLSQCPPLGVGTDVPDSTIGTYMYVSLRPYIPGTDNTIRSVYLDIFTRQEYLLNKSANIPEDTTVIWPSVEEPMGKKLAPL